MKGEVKKVRRLIVNADDFGLSAGINRGVVEAHERGIVTSVSLLVRGAAADEAAAYCRAHPSLSAGLHFELGEWVYREGEWIEVSRVVARDDEAEIEAEAARQLEIFQRLVGREPTHVDSHQHVHREGPARRVLERLAERLSIPLRDCDGRVRFCGEFYGQSAKGWPYPEGIGVERLVRIIGELPEGTTELSCHPGYADDVETAYGEERAREVQTLCDPRVRAAVVSYGVEIISFADVGG